MSGFYELPHPPHRLVGWSAPQVRILADGSRTGLENQINALLANDDAHVLAVSSVTTIPGWFTTVVLQQRVDPLNGGPS